MMRWDDYDAGGVALEVAPDSQVALSGLNPVDAGSFRFLAVVGLIWGVLTGFASLFFPGSAQFSLAAGVLGAMCLSIVYFRSLLPLIALFTTLPGVLILIHAMAALLSTALSPTPVLIICLRYFAVALAVSVILAAVQQGPAGANSLRLGLTAAGTAIALFHLRYLSTDLLSNPTLRVAVYLNPNAIGMICAVTALSLMDYATGQWRLRHLGRAMVLRGLVVICILVVVATKSRTSALSLIAGWVLLRTLYTGGKKIIALGILIALLIVFLPEMRESGLRLYQLDAVSRRWRDPTTLTGRTLIWKSYLGAFASNPLFGIGPGGLAFTTGAFGHNALIQYLAELGLLGTVPIVIMLFLAGVGSFRHRRDPRYYFFIACFGAALVESTAESDLFNAGSPGGLLVLLSITALSVSTAPDSPANMSAVNAEY